MKQLIKNIFDLFGLELRRKIHAPLNNPVVYNSKENTDRFYSDERLVAVYENDQRRSLYKSIITLISKKIDLAKINSVADVSAGTGSLLKEFRQQFPEKKYSGFEMSDSALALCRKNNPDSRFDKADLYAGISESFDLVLCIDTLEHLEHPEKALKNLMASVSPGGFLFLVVPNGRFDTFEGHIHYWSPESFKLFIQNTGFTAFHSHFWPEYGEQALIIKKP